MSSKKIGHWDAQNIAERVANKAFEHLYAPAHEAVTKEAQSIYLQVIADLDLNIVQVNRMVEAGVLRMRKHCTLHFMKNEDGYAFQFVLGTQQYEPEAPRLWICERINVPAELEEELLIVHQKFKEIEVAKGAFAQRIRQDITDKSVTAVIKKWPEIKGFIEDQLGEKLGSETLVVPFSDLIQKYLSPLMALPAPEAA